MIYQKFILVLKKYWWKVQGDSWAWYHRVLTYWWITSLKRTVNCSPYGLHYNIILGLCIEERISSPASVLSSTDQNFLKIRNEILNKKSRRSKRNQFHHRSDHDRNRDYKTWTIKIERFFVIQNSDQWSGTTLAFELPGYPWKGQN